MKKSIQCLCLLTPFLYSPFLFSEARDDCLVREGGIVNYSENDGSDPTKYGNCSIQPDIQRIKFYKLALCTSEPTAPTAVSAVNLSSCTTIWENTSGSSMDILKDTAQKLDGAVTIPVGTFSHFYFEIDPVIGTQAQRNFATPRKGSIAGGGTGYTCWSVALDTPYYEYRDRNISPIIRATNCGSASEANPGVSNHFVNEIDGGYFESFTYEGSRNLDIYLVKDNLMIPNFTPVVDSRNDITKIIGWSPQNITISNDSAKIQLFYNNSKGSEIGFDNEAGNEYVSSFGSGPFDMFITISQ